MAATSAADCGERLSDNQGRPLGAIPDSCPAPTTSFMFNSMPYLQFRSPLLNTSSLIHCTAHTLAIPDHLPLVFRFHELLTVFQQKMDYGWTTCSSSDELSRSSLWINVLPVAMAQ